MRVAENKFLGTVNPAAARIYHRLGWRKLAGTNVMANISSGISPEEFLVDYFRKPGKVAVSLATPDVRVPMIPLILTPHDSQLLDVNVGLYSCRYRTQNSCMGLYPRYVHTLQESQGAFFAARTEDGRVVGLATARPIWQEPSERGFQVNNFQVDGFVHHNFSAALYDLIEAASAWSNTQGASTLCAQISPEDEKKQAVFETLGFAYEGPGKDFDLNRLAKWARHH